MTLSYSLVNTLRGEIFSEDTNRYYAGTTLYPRYCDNTIFTRFLEVVLPYSGECFIPVLGMARTIRLISSWLNSGTQEHPIKVSYPLYVGRADTKRTSDSIIQAINRCPSESRLVNVQTSKGLNYYGGQGLIFDEHWNPLMLCGFIVDINRSSRYVKIVKPVCYISPVVFDNNDILSKAIIKKVIPYISIHGISVPSFIRSNPNFITYVSSSYDHVPVSVEYIDKYFVTPEKPSAIEGLNDSIWDFLANNANELK